MTQILVAVRTYNVDTRIVIYVYTDGQSDFKSAIERQGGTRWRTTLQSRKVAGSIPDGVIGIFHWHNPSSRTMVLGVDSASNRNEYQEYFLGVKAASA